ncbi:MAG: AMIN domain-containing protein [Gammaproteobacteria bacterium]|nr:AMIN domain-containing protein [Gammaproteobacteria bacterium]
MSSIFLRHKIGKLIALLSIYFALHAWNNVRGDQLERLRIWHSPESTRIVFDVSSSTEYNTFTLENPHRLVVDLDQLNLSVELPTVEADNRHLLGVRSGRPSANVLRVVFELGILG